MLDSQFKNYRDNQRQQPGSPITATLRANVQMEKEELESMNQTSSKMASTLGKKGQYLRGLKFNSVKDRFLVMTESKGTIKRVRAAYYLVPMFIFTGVALSKFISHSFGVYLKYQALVDSYYQYKLNQKVEFTPEAVNLLNTEQPPVSAIQEAKERVESVLAVGSA
mmetsp:Transcript_11768/g.19850  ORF Transcript_11768/g.19850 Transcript_11768/m.19850 type:complete len:166 (+) Transcript_11768:252-749(+)